ncbi:MAG: Glycosyl transferase group 1, partial [Methanomicrobiales archaeon 53_19]
MFGGQNSNSGVAKKLFNQVSELNRLGLDVELVLVSVGDVHYPPYDFLTAYKVNSVPMGDFLGRIKRAREISRIFGKVVDSLGPGDVLYYRYSGSFPLYYPNKYLRRFRACKIVTEHQTKELDEFKLTNNVLSYWSDYFFGKVLRKQSDAIVGVTDEITQYEIVRARDPEKPHLTI